jgi:hypothetical protein
VASSDTQRGHSVCEGNWVLYSTADTALNELGQLFAREFGRGYSCDHESVCQASRVLCLSRSTPVSTGRIMMGCDEWANVIGKALRVAREVLDPLHTVMLGLLREFADRQVLALSEYVDHYHEERNRQGKGNVLLFPRNRHLDRERCVQCRERLGGLLRYYHQEAA